LSNQDASHRSRTNSFSSIASADSTIPNLFGDYTTPTRRYYPPSDVESEFDDSSLLDTSGGLTSSPGPTASDAKKLNKLLDIYKNKFSQLKHAYEESEADKERIKKVLAESQDKVLKRVQELKEQAEVDKKLRKNQEFQLQMQLQDRDAKISSLKSQLAAKDIVNRSEAEKLVDVESPTKAAGVGADGIDEIRAKVTKLETLLSRCKELIKTQKASLAEKEKQIGEQEALLEKKESAEKRADEMAAELAHLRGDYELRLGASNDLNASLNTSVERLQKRCTDLSMELDEKVCWKLKLL
jgi:hypothetical protein